MMEYGPREIKIIDETLREGMQTPGLVFSINEKVKISELLDKVGVFGIMVSYPAAHESEVKALESVMALKREGKITSEVIGHGRLIQKDADLIGKTGAFVNLHFPLGFKPTDTELMSAIRKTIKYVKEQYGRIKVDLVDVASLTIDDLKKTSIFVAESGADIICLPDTTGQLTPGKYGRIINEVKKALERENLQTGISVHCHNDYGAAIANTIAGVYNGADYVEVTIGGLGERNGIADLAITCAILEKDGFKTGVNIMSNNLIDLYRYVSTVVNERLNISLIDPRWPIFGDFVSIHTAGTHVMPVKTSLPSRKWGISLTVYTGRHAVKKVTSELGYELTDDQIRKLTKLIKDLSAQKCREITLDELKELISSL